MIKYIIIIIALSGIIYANSIGGEFVSDDIAGILKNTAIADFSAWMKTSDAIHFLIYKAAGLREEAYHLFNIILHSLTSVLVFYFLLNFFKKIPSFFGALLFAAHPIHTEAVSWMSGKDYIIITACILSSFLLYKNVVSKEKNERLNNKPRFLGGYLLSIVLYAIALFSTWHAVFYPAMLVLYDVTYNKWRRNFKFWMPYILTTMVFVWMNNYVLADRLTKITINIMKSSGLGNPVFNMAYSVFNHAKLLLWPANLTLYHEPHIVSYGILMAQISFLVLLLGLMFFLFKRAKAAFFAVGIFIIFLGATYSPVPVSWLVAERYLYLPSVGFVMLIAFLLEKYANSGRAREIAVIFLVMVIGAYSVRTIFRNEDWKSRANLWRATVKVSPLSPRAHNNMGDIYSLEGNYEAAAMAFGRAIELNPDYADAYFNLGLTYKKMGKEYRAVENIKKALVLNPDLNRFVKYPL